MSNLGVLNFETFPLDIEDLLFRIVHRTVRKQCEQKVRVEFRLCAKGTGRVLATFLFFRPCLGRPASKQGQVACERQAGCTSERHAKPFLTILSVIEGCRADNVSLMAAARMNWRERRERPRRGWVRHEFLGGQVLDASRPLGLKSWTPSPFPRPRLWTIQEAR